MSTSTNPSEALLETADIDIITKAQVLLEALPYVQQFRGSTFVVKYGGSFMDDPDPELRARVATDIVFLAAVGVNVVVVHGGGKAISRAMSEEGVEPVWKDGLRVTDAAAIRLVQKVLNETVNLDICELMQARGGRPLGMQGQTCLVCDPLREDEQGNPVDLGFVGQPKVVKTKLIKKALRDGYTPVLSPLALDEAGQVYNTNADAAASAVASALRARRLVYLSDVPGLLRNPQEPDSLISTLHVGEVPGLIDSGVIASGMLPKVQSAVSAINSGVHRVHLVDARVPHSILLEIFTDRGVGTEIVNR